MSISQRPAARYARTALLTAFTAGAGLAGLLGVGGVAQASTGHAARPDGYVVYTNCTGVTGSISYSPGLQKFKAKNVHATLTGTTSGCGNIFDGALSGTGTITATLTGKATSKAENFSGTFTINWPASSGYEPSDGTLSVSESNGEENIQGEVTSGFETDAVVSMQYVTNGNTGNGTKSKPITAQSYTNTQELALSENPG